MRLKEDSSSWKSSGIVKRDFKHDSSQPTAIKPRPRKDTKRWCKGKVGVEHNYVMTVPPNDPSSIRGFRRMNICTNCGRQDYGKNGVEYFCRYHKVWSKHPHWNEEHTHEREQSEA